jgi:probable F420-dependent oxidoreductase
VKHSADGVRKGVVFPQGSLPGDPDSVRQYVAGIEGLGYDHLVVPDHVLGVDPEAHPGWSGVYDVHDSFHEPLVLFGFLAAITRLELVAGVIVLPQRQAVVVAKQAAEIDLLSGGRLRLGVGIGWNSVEFEGIGAEFRSRGRRIDEQIAVMRALWADPVVDFQGQEHSLSGVGISPLPPRKTIAVWVGAETAPAAFRRVGRIADGWMAMGPPVAAARDALGTIRRAAEEAGRDPDSIGIQAWVDAGDRDFVRAREEIRGWTELGATHVAVSTRGGGPQAIEDHLAIACEVLGGFS